MRLKRLTLIQTQAHRFRFSHGRVGRYGRACPNG